MPISEDVQLDDGVSIAHPELVNFYGCSIGARTKIGPFVEIQKNAAVGPSCKIGSHTFICEGVTVEDECFIGHHFCSRMTAIRARRQGRAFADRSRLASNPHACLPSARLGLVQ